MGDISVMQIAPDQGAFLTLLCQAIGAREALELGTFTGYSAICIARGLAPGGRLIACELSEEYAGIAAAQPRPPPGSPTGSRSGSARRSRRCARCPSARPSTSRFIDADKAGYPEYYELVLARTRPGGLIVVDNVLAAGGVVDARRRPAPEARGDPRAQRPDRRRRARRHRRWSAIADGLTLARKR